MLDEIVSVTEQVQILGTRKFDFHEKVFGHVIKIKFANEIRHNYCSKTSNQTHSREILKTNLVLWSLSFFL